MNNRGASATHERVILVSADCHAGPQVMADYGPYVPAEHKAAFDEYIRSVEAFDAAQAAANGLPLAQSRRQGGARAHDDEGGLWDMGVRVKHLEADGVAAEVIFTQGALPFGPYPAVGPAKRIEWMTPEQRNAGTEIYN